MKSLVFKSVLAGFLIALAGIIYLQCPNKIVGACLFSIGLVAVIFLETNLFTGKIGYVNSKESAINAVIILLINCGAAFLVGCLYRVCVGTSLAMDSRIDKSWYRLIFDGVGCGALIYLAVELYKKSKNIIVIILPVVCFILAGFEHSIADCFYYGASELTLEGLYKIFLVIIGNSIGSLLIRFLQKQGETLLQKEAK